MSFNVQFYRVAKRKNSFYRPATADASLTVQCNIKSDSGVLHPVLEIASGTNDFNPTNWNYVRIDPYNDRYYFVRDWKYEGGMWVCYCDPDVLASFKEEIVGLNYYFLRSSVLYDENIIDGLYPTTTAVTKYYSTGSIWPRAGASSNRVSYEQGAIIANIIGQDGTSNFYYFTTTAWASFCNTVFADITWTDIADSDISDAIAKLAFNPFEYIVSAKWYPCVPTSIITEIDTLTFGWWNLSLTQPCYLFDETQVSNYTLTLNTGHHPGYSSRGNYVDKPPFTSCEISSPLFGSMNVNTMRINVGSPIQIQVMVDFSNGQGRMIVGQGGYVIGMLDARVCLDFLMTSLRENFAEEIGGFVQSAADLFGGNFVGAAAGLVSTFSSFVGRDVNAKGATGGAIAAESGIRLEMYFKGLTSFDDSDNGRPCCKNGVMLTLGEGYYIVENGSVNILGALSEEMDMIRQYLESGVYYDGIVQ